MPGHCFRCGQPLGGVEPDPTAGDQASATPDTGAAKRRRVRSIAVAAVALGAIAGSGAYIAVALPDLLPLSAPAVKPSDIKPPPPAQATGEDPSKRSQLLIFGGGAGTPGAIGLTRPGKVHDITDIADDFIDAAGHTVSFQGLLTREICRQAVLIAARDGLGLATRDGTLGEPMPGGNPAPALEVVAPIRFGELAGLQLRQGKDASSEVILRSELVRLRGGQYDRIDLLKLVKAAEALSRTELPGALKRAGLAGKPDAVKADAPVPEEAADRLDRMAFTDQFAAVRALHAAIRADGESPRRLAALSRGYAHLGLLTGFQWNAMYKVYQARALLYAQRVVARAPKSPWGLWHRAYAAALAGLHKDALDDLDAARRLAGATPPTGGLTRPEWVDLIDALCRYDTGRLSGHAGPYAELARVLALLTVELPTGSAVTLNAARAAIEANPECFLAHDLACACGGVANLHTATVAGPEVLATVVPRKVAALPSAPPGVQNPATAEALTRALDEAADPGHDRGEPSWGALSRTIRETRFVQVWRRLAFMRDAWSVPTDDYWEEARPLVADHPLRPFLHTYIVGAANPDSGFPALAKALDCTDFNVNAYPLFWKVHGVASKRDYAYTYSLARLHTDSVAHDIAVEAVRKGDKRHDAADRLLRVSPYSPVAMAALIETDWDTAREHLADWEKTAGDHPAFLAALARQYGELGRFDDAERYLTRYIKQSPDLWAFEQLANGYRRRGDLRRWRETLDGFLENVEDNRLDHAKVRVAIANELMNAGKYGEARPYADAAAMTWAGWAMECAARCAEGQRDWKAAEFWTRSQAERYPGSCWANWLLFCLRTGHGNQVAAATWTRRYAGAMVDQLVGNALVPIAAASLLDGDPVGATATLKRATETGADDITIVLILALTADAAGDAETRDAALERVRADTEEVNRNSVTLATMFRESLDGETEGTLDLAKLDAMLKKTSDRGRGNAATFAAWFLTNHDRLDDAKPYWRTAAESPHTYIWFKVFATDTLRKRYHETVPAGSESAT